MEKFFDGDTQTITQLFDGGDGGAVITPADNIVDGGLGDTADSTKFVDGNIRFLT